MLNQREINWIRNVYYPTRESRVCNKSYSSFNKEYRGAASDW